MLHFRFATANSLGGRPLDKAVASDLEQTFLDHLQPGSPLRKVYTSLLWKSEAYARQQSIAEQAEANADADAWLSDLLEGKRNVSVRFTFEKEDFSSWGVARLQTGNTMYTSMHGSFVEVLLKKELGHPDDSKLTPKERRWSGLFAFYTTAHHELLHHFRFARFGSEGHSGYVLEDNHLGGILRVWWRQGCRWDWSRLQAIGIDSVYGQRLLCSGSYSEVAVEFSSLTPEKVRDWSEAGDVAPEGAERGRLPVDCDSVIGAVVYDTVEHRGGSHGRAVSSKEENALEGQSSRLKSFNIEKSKCDSDKASWARFFEDPNSVEMSTDEERCQRDPPR